ncbi:hypothetical protein [Mucilaginibacter jinjuensis]|uniref:Uncharacterized protein n=1 Tax=Mucilaginibacter jinjuensis TaxID=1176721 RepID=A0ABY7T6G1_9SPHI|nr:hypothetical protein [Mucilaginibacter jinjuensis]WCT12075.1 hypothetical protein PQO05_25415 [Mucilaginibacter jinjuensis]
MEVHYHPEEHHKHRKKFKEYLKEGLMIFVAVFMGFIAENIREHITDRIKEKEYAASLVRDLQQDSIKLSEVIAEQKLLDKGKDSLIAVLSDSTSSPNFTDNAYRLFFKYGTSIAVFNSTDRTMSQLLSTGNLRLIEKQEVANKISDYYDRVKDAGTQVALNNTSADDCFQYAQNLFIFQYGLKPKTPNKQLITRDHDTMVKYINKLTQMKIAEQFYVLNDLKQVNKSCIELIKLLKTEYHIS